MQDKDKIELAYRYNSLFDDSMSIKLNGEILKDIRISDIGYYTSNFGRRFMTLQLNIPLDKYEISINSDTEEKLNKK
jgi:hypothetical protein|nr:MAG TPA: beta porphyranase A [Caudoviricetes sp.]